MDLTLFSEALSAGGLLRLTVAITIAVLLGGYWVILLVQGRILKSFYLFIILFPASYYATRTFGFTAYVAEGEVPFEQKIGLTTLMLLLLLLHLLVTGKFRRGNSAMYRFFERGLWYYCVFVTLSQFFNHTIVSAVGLSIGASWQYLVLFYVATSIIETEDHIVGMLNAILIFIVFNKVLLMIAKGGPFIRSLQSDDTAIYLREGIVGALGHPVSAAGYLAISITLALGLYYRRRNVLYLLFAVYAFLELLNTFTRGGIFILFVLAFLFVFKEQRRILWTGAVLAVLAIPFWDMIWQYVSYRGFSINITDEGNFVFRLVLTSLYFTEYYSFSVFGNGILKPTLIDVGGRVPYQLHNAYLEVLDTCGVVPFIILIAVSVLSVKYLINLYQLTAQTGKRHSGHSLVPFFIVSLIQWIIYANTTSTSVLYYYPYEATAIFWILCFSPVFFQQANIFSPKWTHKNETKALIA